MRILRLHHPTGHAYWGACEFKVELPDGTIYDKSKHYPKDWNDGHKIKVENGGIYYQQCYCSSGGGKREATDRYPPVLMVHASEYDKIEYVGTPLTMSEELKEDLAINQLW